MSNKTMMYDKLLDEKYKLINNIIKLESILSDPYIDIKNSSHKIYIENLKKEIAKSKYRIENINEQLGINNLKIVR